MGLVSPRFLGAAALLALAAPCFATPRDAWVRPRFELPLVETAPIIDGDLDDACWKRAFHASDFVRFAGSMPVSEPTEARIIASASVLFIAFHCKDAAPERIRASETQRGSRAVWQDDHVAIEIDSQNTRRGRSSFVVSARGTQTESLEGGTADNIAWSGDWRAATKRVDDGWTCEIAIPFRLLRYARGTSAVGILLSRYLARETNEMTWPALPPAGQTYESRVQFFPEAALPRPLPSAALRPLVMPYALSSAGAGGAATVRQGVDVKLPLSTSVTGLLAIRPDFQTIENDVADIGFSYNEQFVADRRPFFAEGAEYLPARDLFYSRRIGQFDEGVKVVGKSENTLVGFVGARQEGSESRGRDSAALRVEQSFGTLSNIGVVATADNAAGNPTNRVARAYGALGWQRGDRRFFLGANRSQSFVASAARGGAFDLSFRSRGPQGTPNFRIVFDGVDADFTSRLGLVQDPDRRRFGLGVFQNNRFDRGTIEAYEAGMNADTARRQTGGRFYDQIGGWGSVSTRRGLRIESNASVGRRSQGVGGPITQDRLLSSGLAWNQRTLFQGGGISWTGGRQAGAALRTISLRQGILVASPVSVVFRLVEQQYGTTTTRQSIVTGTYRLDPFRAISGRLVSQTGTGNAANVGPTRGTNLYVGYAQRSRRGTDIFVILGDPNAENTRTRVTIKAVRPIS